MLNVRVDDDRKAAYEAKAAELGMSVSSWLRSLADNDCDNAVTRSEDAKRILPRAASKASPPKVATKVVQKAGIDIVVPTKSAGRQCGHFYCKMERGKGKVGDCFM